ncbi:hypothetical protein AGLY_005026 [Aphis glycines]|uniref:Uncharacterized protein n=1 Tax=Aphis glycines TaxID=307491 RepID=A0A6G0TVZ1_APHGL|nr:hypothetical protein AGLY_005026 [Aphis glycines]
MFFEHKNVAITQNKVKGDYKKVWNIINEAMYNKFFEFWILKINYTKEKIKIHIFCCKECISFYALELSNNTLKQIIDYTFLLMHIFNIFLTSTVLTNSYVIKGSGEMFKKIFYDFLEKFFFSKNQFDFRDTKKNRSQQKYSEKYSGFEYEIKLYTIIQKVSNFTDKSIKCILSSENDRVSTLSIFKYIKFLKEYSSNCTDINAFRLNIQYVAKNQIEANGISKINYNEFAIVFKHILILNHTDVVQEVT